MTREGLTREGFKKHRDLIESWANGAEIEFLSGGEWILVREPQWQESLTYRIRLEKFTHFRKDRLYNLEVNSEELCHTRPVLYDNDLLYQYVGEIDTVAGKRHIFYNSSISTYIMFSDNTHKYVLSEHDLNHKIIQEYEIQI